MINDIPKWITENNTPEHLAKLQGLTNEPDVGDYGVIVIGKKRPEVFGMGMSEEEATNMIIDIEDGDPDATVFLFKIVEPDEWD